MRLADLDPRWYEGRSGDRQGITFACPCCKSMRLAVALHIDGTDFDPDPDSPQQMAAVEHVWTIAGGDNLLNISITPSIDASNYGHWHGFITDGKIVGGI